MNHEEVSAKELNDYMDSLEKEIIQLEQENRELKAQVEQLNALIIKMQERATLFLQPDGESESEFVNFIIGILDGPEQRLAQPAPAQGGYQQRPAQQQMRPACNRCYDDRENASALAATPLQCLAEVKAQAGRDGFIAGYFHCRNEGFQFEDELENSADAYANQIRQQTKVGE